jgi:hypothetical protein
MARCRKEVATTDEDGFPIINLPDKPEPGDMLFLIWGKFICPLLALLSVAAGLVSFAAHFIWGEPSILYGFVLGTIMMLTGGCLWRHRKQ